MSRNIRKKHVELNADTLDWFETTYPNGSLSGVLSMLLDAFKEVSTVSPREYAMLAAEKIKEELRQ